MDPADMMAALRAAGPPVGQRRLERWAVAAVLLPFVIGFSAIVAATIALARLYDEPWRRGRSLAWAGAILSCLQLVLLAVAVAWFLS